MAEMEVLKSETRTQKPMFHPQLQFTGVTWSWPQKTYIGNGPFHGSTNGNSELQQ